MVIMVGGHSQFNAFAGDRVHALFFGGVAMAATG